jgi:hypothetical protein
MRTKRTATRSASLWIGVACLAALAAGSCGGENTPTGACRISATSCIDSTLGECRAVNGNFRSGVSCSGRSLSATPGGSSVLAPSGAREW